MTFGDDGRELDLPDCRPYRQGRGRKRQGHTDVEMIAPDEPSRLKSLDMWGRYPCAKLCICTLVVVVICHDESKDTE